MNDECGFSGSRKPPEGTKAGELMDCPACKAKLMWGFSAIPVLLQVPLHERGKNQLWTPYRGQRIETKDGSFVVIPPKTNDFSITETIEEACKFIDTLIDE